MIGAVVVWWDRRQRRLRNERPPLDTKLLRPPGHSLAVALDDLWDRTQTRWVGAACVAALLAAAVPSIGQLIYGLLVGRFTLAGLYASTNRGPMIGATLFTFGIVLLLVYLLHGLVTMQLTARQYRLGLRGEQAVGEALNSPEVIRAGYRSFHDVPGDGKWNIDHIAVGPGGVFVIETKTRSKRRSVNHLPEHEVEFDGQVLQFPWGYDREAVKQVQRNVEWVRKFLAGFSPQDIPVQPVIVLPGWFVRSKGNYPVKAMNAKYLADGFLRSTPRRLDAEQLTPVLRRLDERCRTLDF